MGSQRAERREPITRGTGDVFADLGFPNAAERQAKERDCTYSASRSKKVAVNRTERTPGRMPTFVNVGRSAHAADCQDL